MSVRINIAGDVCITTAYTSKTLLHGSVKEHYRSGDINIVNLECPVNEHGDTYKIVKHGPHLCTGSAVFDQLRQLNISAVTLANNHILDYGMPGLQSTMKGCRENNIAFTGAGNTLEEANEYLLLEKNNLKIAVVNFCENEWSVATGTEGGANPLDVIENSRQIRKAKAAADFVLVIVHGGNEYYNLPSPRMVKQYRYFAEQGADAVISHHTHCVSGYEIYQDVPIFYGLGNMLFTKPSEQPGWFTGLTVQLTLEKGKAVQYEIIPTAQSREDNQLSVLDGEAKQAVLNEVEGYKNIIADSKKLKAAWDAFIIKRAPQYLYNFSAVPAMPGRYLQSALRRFGFVNKLLPKKYLTGVINYICCEAHLDVATEVLKRKLYNK